MRLELKMLASWANMKRVSIGSVLLAALLLQACTKELKIEVSTETGAPVLAFMEPKFVFWSEPSAACVKLISVHDHASNHVVWAIRPFNATCVKVQQVRVGKIPSGFEIKGTGSTLVTGRSYYAVAIAEGEAGQSDPWLQP